MTGMGCIYDVDAESGQCTQTANALNRPRQVEVSSDGKSVYVVSEEDHAIVHFERDTSTGALTPRGCIDDNDNGPDTCAASTDGLGGAGSLAISPDGKSVYATSYQDDAIVMFARDTTTGALSPQGCIDDNDDGPDTCAQSADGLNHLDDAVVSADGRSVYVAGKEDAAIVSFSRDTSTGILTPQGCVDDNDTGPETCASSTDGLHLVSHVAISPDGESVYATGAGDDALVGFDRDPSTGALTPLGCVDDPDTGTEPCTLAADGLEDAGEVIVSPDGGFLYVASPGDDAIVRFARNDGGGPLSPQGCIDNNEPTSCSAGPSTAGLEGVYKLAMPSDGRSLYAASIGDGAVVRFDRNTSDGVLTPAGCIKDNDTGFDICAATTDELDQTHAVAVSPDGTSVYATSISDDAIAMIRLQAPPAPECSTGEAICGGAGNDELEGTPEDDLIFAGAGDDTIDGGGGNDVIVGGGGDDELVGADGNDILVGDDRAGNPKVRAALAARGVYLVQDPEAEPGDDTIDGGAGKDQITGGGGLDMVTGGSGNDKADGGAANDTLAGAGGDDRLTGGPGADKLNGGPGKDVCVISKKAGKDQTIACESKPKRNNM